MVNAQSVFDVPRSTAVLKNRELPTVNDVHSRLNRTVVAGIASIESVSGLQDAVREAVRDRRQIAICGGRHAMGGQQFATRSLLLDMRPMDRVLELDAERGLVTVEAGIDWPRLVTHLLWSGAGLPQAWGIIQKQTGADRLTIGGALSANIHGRGLRLRPFVGDIESFELVDATGALLRCSRTANADLFRLAIGGYGLFGAIARVTLRLARRHKLQRHVTIGCVDALPELFDRRIRDGYEYGDFQFATDPRSREFLQAGVFSCYRPVDLDTIVPEGQRTLTPQHWYRLLLLAHMDKSRAFAEYARYYMSTEGQIYWSDTHQLAEYTDGYHAQLDEHLSKPHGSEMISELYVPRSALPAFMAAVRRDAQRYQPNIIYGTIRVIERDDETMLAWAREPWACVVFNLHVEHSAEGQTQAAAHFRRLIDRALELGGSYYLTYHRWATREQVEVAHPRLCEFLAAKRQYDPGDVFQSDWYTHHARLFGETHALTNQGENQ